MNPSQLVTSIFFKLLRSGWGKILKRESLIGLLVSGKPSLNFPASYILIDTSQILTLLSNPNARVLSHCHITCSVTTVQEAGLAQTRSLRSHPRSSLMLDVWPYINSTYTRKVRVATLLLLQWNLRKVLSDLPKVTPNLSEALVP